MTKLDINNMLVGNLIAQIAPIVERETGWSLDVPELNWRVLPKSRGYEEIVQRRLRNTGVAVEENARSLPERMLEVALEANILAAYEPGSNMLFVVRENVDDSNLQGLMVILTHELVHRGQHVHHPELFERVDATVRMMVEQLATAGPDPQQTRAWLDSIQSTMTLIESHATYVQQRIQARYFPEAKIERHFNFLTIMGMAFAGQKAAQYTSGLPLVAQAAESGQIEQLFASVSRGM